MSGSGQAAVTSEASEGQSAMEMVILYWVSLGRGEESVSTGISTTPTRRGRWNISSRADEQPRMMRWGGTRRPPRHGCGTGCGTHLHVSLQESMQICRCCTLDLSDE